MADNTNEQLGSSRTIQAENPSNLITPANNTQAITPTQETETMEVHKHPHHVMHKKKWNEYLLEFFMLFLAVFLGFVAENLREHFSNKETEKRNIESYVKTLQKDSTEIFLSVKGFQHNSDLINSLGNIPGNFSDTAFQRPFFKYALQLTTTHYFVPDETVFQQMQSSGSLRFIHKQNILDSILNYQAQNQRLELQKAYVDSWFRPSIEYLAHITDFRNAVKNQPLKIITADQPVLDYINYKLAESVATRRYIEMLQKQMDNLRRLIPFLKQEYNIE